VHYRGGFKRKLDKTWLPFSKADFEVNTYDINDGSATENYDACCKNPADGVCIAAGADTKGSTGTCCSFIDAEHGSVCQPCKKPIVLKNVEMQGKRVKWVCEREGMPQFSYTVSVEGEVIACGEVENEVCVDEAVKDEANVRVEVEDILGNCSSSS
jgi:hypothetical protein